MTTQTKRRKSATPTARPRTASPSEPAITPTRLPEGMRARLRTRWMSPEATQQLHELTELARSLGLVHGFEADVDRDHLIDLVFAHGGEALRQIVLEASDS